MFFSTKADAPESDGGGGDQSQEPNQYEDEYEEQPAEKNQESGEQVPLLIKFILPPLFVLRNLWTAPNLVDPPVRQYHLGPSGAYFELVLLGAIYSLVVYCNTNKNKMKQLAYIKYCGCFIDF